MALIILFFLLSFCEFLSGKELEGKSQGTKVQVIFRIEQIITLWVVVVLFKKKNHLFPENADTYWSGTAPICMGGCKGKHKELKKSTCGNGSCCWLGYKSFCRVNCGRPETEFNSVVYGNDWWVGSVVRYSCRPGYLLMGDPASACQSSGRWTPKPTCLRICLRGRIEINERDIDGSCSSTCPHKVYPGAFLNHGCIKISSCVTKQSGWTRWFSRCDFCECDCYVPCASSG
ncbi:inactive serine protease PAMR1-like [Podarcis muralis]